MLAAAAPTTLYFTKTESTFTPLSTPLIQRKSYTLSYDAKTRNPSWVYEKLTPTSLTKNATRNDYDFTEDPDVPPSHRSTKKDYQGSGFDRGHMCPAADAAANPEALKETFYLSNISPQNPQLNRKYWLKIERHARTLSKNHGSVEIVSGPLFLPETKEDGKRFVTYQVIGKNDVAVPTHFFKALRYQKEGKQQTEAFIVPNKPLDDQPLSNFQVPLVDIERTAGIIFQ